MQMVLELLEVLVEEIPTQHQHLRQEQLMKDFLVVLRLQVVVKIMVVEVVEVLVLSVEMVLQVMVVMVVQVLILQ